MNTVVFGGSGFLGSYVADELLRRGFQVTIADIKPSAYLQPGQKYLCCDIQDRRAVENVISEDVRYVFNFAGLADLNEAIHLPVETMQLNVLGNMNILEVCRTRSIHRYVYASSAYAFSTKGSFYGISKYTSEKIVEEYYTRYKVPYTIVRYGSLYGERADRHNYIYTLLKQALVEKKIVVKGDDEDIREYIHAQDAARLSVDIMMDGKYAHEHLVLTGFEKMKKIELFQMIKEILHDNVEIVRSEVVQEGHYRVTPYSFAPNIAKKLIANPFIDMGQGLVDCMKHIHVDLIKDSGQ